ncbi:MAG: hypothetical protein NVSMB5_04090 [Candidatus Velthaea sp.]
MNPYFLNMFWQIPDGLEILNGHFPASVGYAISSGPLVNQSWLYEAALAACARAHLYGAFVIACALAAAATPLLVYVLVRTCGAADVNAGVAAFLVVGTRFTGSAIRPETFAVDAFALTLIITLGRLPLVWIVPVVAIWANVHASVVLAPASIVIVTFGEWYARKRFDGAVRHRAVALAASCFALLLTPSGVSLIAYAFSLTVGANPVRRQLEAWAPLSFGNIGHISAVLPGLIILTVCGIARHRRYAAVTLLAAACFVVTLEHGRYATFLSVAWAPLIALSLERLPRMRALAQRRPRAPVPALAPLAIFAAIPLAAAWNTPLEPRGAWRAGAAIVRAHHVHGNVYAPIVWAAYLHWQGLPLRVLIDAHGDPYPDDVWADYLALERVRPNWHEVLQRRAIDVVLVAFDTPLAAVLMAAPDWRQLDERDGITAFVRR